MPFTSEIRIEDGFSEPLEEFKSLLGTTKTASMAVGKALIEQRKCFKELGDQVQDCASSVKDEIIPGFVDFKDSVKNVKDSLVALKQDFNFENFKNAMRSTVDATKKVASVTKDAAKAWVEVNLGIEEGTTKLGKFVTLFYTFVNLKRSIILGTITGSAELLKTSYIKAIDHVIKHVEKSFDTLNLASKMNAMWGEAGDFSQKRAYQLANEMGETAASVAEASARAAYEGVGQDHFERMIKMSDKIAKLSPNRDTLETFNELLSNVKSGHDAGGFAQMLGGGQVMERQLRRQGFERALNRGDLTRALDIAEKVAKQAGITNERYAKSNESMASNFKKINNTINNIKQNLHDIYTKNFEPTVKKITEIIQGDKFQKIIKIFERLVDLAGKFAGSITEGLIDNLPTLGALLGGSFISKLATGQHLIVGAYNIYKKLSADGSGNIGKNIVAMFKGLWNRRTLSAEIETAAKDAAKKSSIQNAFVDEKKSMADLKKTVNDVNKSISDFNSIAKEVEEFRNNAAKGLMKMDYSGQSDWLKNKRDESAALAKSMKEAGKGQDNPIADGLAKQMKQNAKVYDKLLKDRQDKLNSAAKSFGKNKLAEESGFKFNKEVGGVDAKELLKSAKGFKEQFYAGAEAIEKSKTILGTLTAPIKAIGEKLFGANLQWVKMQANIKKNQLLLGLARKSKSKALLADIVSGGSTKKKFKDQLAASIAQRDNLIGLSKNAKKAGLSKNVQNQLKERIKAQNKLIGAQKKSLRLLNLAHAKNVAIAALKVAGPWLLAAGAIALALKGMQALIGGGVTLKGVLLGGYQFAMNAFENLFIAIDKGLKWLHIGYLKIKKGINELMYTIKQKVKDLVLWLVQKLEAFAQSSVGHALRKLGIDLYGGADDIRAWTEDLGADNLKEIVAIDKEVEEIKKNMPKFIDVMKGVEEAYKTNGDSVVAGLKALFGVNKSTDENVKKTQTDTNKIRKMNEQEEELKWLRAFSDRQIMSSYNSMTTYNRNVTINGMSQSSLAEMGRRNVSTIPSRASR